MKVYGELLEYFKLYYMFNLTTIAVWKLNSWHSTHKTDLTKTL